METLVAIPQDYHHHFCARKWRRGSKKFRSFDSTPNPNIRSSINCSKFRYGERIVATPYSIPAPVTKPDLSTKFPPPNENQRLSKRAAKCSSVRATIKSKIDSEQRNLYYSDLWAGPTYSNSPPPSSVPLPKFSVGRKRSVSLDFPKVVSEIDLHPIAKSEPGSPPRDWSVSPDNVFVASDSATKTLRRILNLDVSAE